MIKLLPLVIALGYGLAMWYFSVWRSRRMLDTNSTDLADPELRHVSRRLARALDLDDIPVKVFEIDPVNGLADLDGRIFLTRGFLNKHRSGQVSAEELASVIAHELGHVALGHTRRRMIDFTGANAVFVGVVALVLRAIPVLGPLIAILLARVVTTALAARLSRRDEYEADAWAAALMVKAGFGTGPQKSLFRKLERLSGGNLRDIPAWLLGHPRPEERIQAIEETEARWREAARLPPG